jgi:hypothetical protein
LGVGRFRVYRTPEAGARWRKGDEVSERCPKLGIDPNRPKKNPLRTLYSEGVYIGVSDGIRTRDGQIHSLVL